MTAQKDVIQQSQVYNLFFISNFSAIGRPRPEDDRPLVEAFGWVFRVLNYQQSAINY